MIKVIIVIAIIVIVLYIITIIAWWKIDERVLRLEALVKCLESEMKALRKQINEGSEQE